MDDLEKLRWLAHKFELYANQPNNTLTIHYIKQDTGRYAYVAVVSIEDTNDIFNLHESYQEAEESLIFLVKDLEWLW